MHLSPFTFYNYIKAHTKKMNLALWEINKKWIEKKREWAKANEIQMKESSQLSWRE